MLGNRWYRTYEPAQPLEKYFWTEYSKQFVEYEELAFPDEIHSFLLHRYWPAAYSAEDDFFRRHLMEPSQPAAKEPKH